MNYLLETEITTFSRFRKYDRAGANSGNSRNGIYNAIQEVYPQVKYQACCVQLARNTSHKVRVLDRAEICEDFKSVYRSDDKHLLY